MPVPAKMRRSLSPDAKETFVATRGFEPCISLYPLDQWEVIEATLGAKNQFIAENRAFARALLNWAEELTLDGQGRVSLPKTLLEFAGLEPGTKAFVVGVSNRIEVWHKPAYEEIYESHGDYTMLAEKVMG